MQARCHPQPHSSIFGDGWLGCGGRERVLSGPAGLAEDWGGHAWNAGNTCWHSWYIAWPKIVKSLPQCRFQNWVWAMNRYRKKSYCFASTNLSKMSSSNPSPSCPKFSTQLQVLRGGEKDILNIVSIRWPFISSNYYSYIKRDSVKSSESFPCAGQQDTHRPGGTDFCRPVWFLDWNVSLGFEKEMSGLHLPAQLFIYLFSFFIGAVELVI